MGTSRNVRSLLLTMAVVVGLLTPSIAAAQGPPDHAPARGHVRSEQQQWGEEAATSSTLDHVAHAIRSHEAVAAGIDGSGIGIALIDTGVSPVEGLRDVVHGPDLSLDAPNEALRHLDAYGHGTHLAGLITSDRPDARGIAPGATLVSVKAGAARGAVDVTQVIAAVDWVVQRRADHNIRVLVLPYGTDGMQDPAFDPLMHAVEVAWEHGIVVVASAGNDGEHSPVLANPARTPSVISVAALNTQGTTRPSDDEVAPFSAPGTAQRRPDLAAPGVGMVSLQAPGSYLADTYPQAIRPDALFRGHGTSQAAAVTGAAAALLLDADPSLTPDQVKGVLVDSAVMRGGLDDPAAGAGIVSVADALTLLDGSLDAYAQPDAGSTGTGSVEDARGSHHVINAARDQLLVGEYDIHGQPFDTASWAAAAASGTTWSDGTWNGTDWTGTGWSSDTTGSWDGLSWDGLSWDGLSWDGLSWDGLSWDGLSWDGLSWDGLSWDGLSWDGLSWDGLSWDSVRWD